MSEELPVRASATVVLLRDQADQLEVYLLKRAAADKVLANAYVFPGGKIERTDNDPEQLVLWQAPAADDAAAALSQTDAALAQALFVAAARETFEEAGVKLPANTLVPLSRWITPVTPQMMNRRFDTRFFLARMPENQQAQFNASESADGIWISPRAALEQHWAGEMALAPPQTMTLVSLMHWGSLDAVFREAMGRAAPVIQPEPFVIDGLRGVAYPGDPLHPVRERALVGPSRLYLRNGRLEPETGFEGFFAA